MNIILSNVVAISTKDISLDVFNELVAFSVHEDPDWIVRRTKGFFVRPEDRYIYSFSITKDGQYYTFSRGLFSKITEVLHAHSYAYTVEDRRVKYDTFDIFMKYNKTLFKFQERAVNDLIQGEDGILVADCGAGKTVMGAAVIAAIKQPTLVVVTTLDIQKQWVESIEEFTDYKKHKIGTIGGGKMKIKPITISTFQTLCKLDRAEWEKINSTFGCLIMDECQHAPSNSLMTIANRSKARYRYGFTATPSRKDKKEFMMFDTLGHRTINISQDELEAEGRLMVPSVKFIPMVTRLEMPTMMRWDGVKKVPDNNWSKFYTDMSVSADRNDKILASIRDTIEQGHKCLVLSNRVEHCEFLYHSLRAAGFKCGTMLGTMKADHRKSSVKQARDGDFDAVVATTSLAAEGLNIPIISCVHLVMPTSNTTFLKQAIGRACRVVEGKLPALAIDYVDIDCEILYNMYCGRKRFYKSIGYTLLNDLKNNQY